MPHFDQASSDFRNSLSDTRDTRAMDAILDNPNPNHGELNGHTYQGFPVYHEHRYNPQIGKCIWAYDAATDTVYFIGFYREQGRRYELIDGTPNAPRTIRF